MRISLDNLLSDQKYYLYSWDGFEAKYVVDSLGSIPQSKFLDMRTIGLSSLKKFSMEKKDIPAQLFERRKPSTIRGFIFHMGHVGSTLIANMLAVDKKTLCLREPLPLRYLAKEFQSLRNGGSSLGWDEYCKEFSFVLNSLDRPYEDRKKSIIKCTSGVLQIAPQLLTATGMPSIFLYMKPIRYIANLIRPDGGRLDLLDRIDASLIRLNAIQSYKHVVLKGATLGEMAAIVWLADYLSAVSISANPLLEMTLVDFDSFLEKPTHNIQRINKLFQPKNTKSNLPLADLETVLNSYSKSADEKKFTKEDREQLIAANIDLFADEIAHARALLEEWVPFVPDLKAMLTSENKHS